MQNGRNENEQESKEFDERFKDCLDKAGYPYATFPGDIDYVEPICRCIEDYYDVVILNLENIDEKRVY